MTASTATTNAYPRPDALQHMSLSQPQLRVLDAAAEAFMERGYDATSIDEIAERIGATKGAVYYSYRSKLDIFLGVYERGMRQLEEHVFRALHSAADASASERLRAVSVAHAENLMQNYSYHVAIQTAVEQRRAMPLRDGERERISQLDRLRSKHESLVHALIEEGQTDGSVRAVDTSLATRTLLGGIVGVAIWYRPRPEQTDHERSILASKVVDLLMAGTLPR